MSINDTFSVDTTTLKQILLAHASLEEQVQLKKLIETGLNYQKIISMKL